MAFKPQIIRLYFIEILTVMSVFLVMQMNMGGNEQNPLPIGKQKKEKFLTTPLKFDEVQVFLVSGGKYIYILFSH